jgi:hypothetical protein
LEIENMKPKFLFLLVFLIINVLVFTSLIPLVNANGDDIISEIKIQILELGCWLFRFLFYISSAIAALFILLSGFQYITSDSPEMRCEARNRMMYAVVGLIIILIACPLVNYIIDQTEISKVKTQIEGTETKCCPTAGFDLFKLLEVLICRIIVLIYHIVGAFAALILVIAGVRYITAEGPDERENAKRIAVNAIIGLIIVLIAIPLVNYLVRPYEMLNCAIYIKETAAPEEPGQVFDCIDPEGIEGEKICKEDDGTWEIWQCTGGEWTFVKTCPPLLSCKEGRCCRGIGKRCRDNSDCCSNLCEKFDLTAPEKVCKPLEEEEEPPTEEEEEAPQICILQDTCKKCLKISGCAWCPTPPVGLDNCMEGADCNMLCPDPDAPFGGTSRCILTSDECQEEGKESTAAPSTDNEEEESESQAEGGISFNNFETITEKFTP